MSAKLTFKFSYKKNGGLLMSPSELQSMYLFGTAIRDGLGRPYSTNDVRRYIISAQQQIEKLLSIKIIPQSVQEDRSYYVEDYQNWSYLKTTFPVAAALKLSGVIGEQPQVEYPSEWLSWKRSSEERYSRNINILPGQGGITNTSSVIFSGIYPQLSMLGRTLIPNYWQVYYITGYQNIPYDLLNIIGKLASINLFHIAGDLILGAGIASYSLGIDGLSQSISSTSSATNAGYGARVTGYLEDLKQDLPRVQQIYKGLAFTSL